MTDDEKYREHVKATLNIQEHYVFALTRHRIEYITKHRIWLKLLGLIETSELPK